MADKKISGMTALTATAVADDDEFMVRDVSAPIGKRMTVGEVRKALGGVLKYIGSIAVAGDITCTPLFNPFGLTCSAIVDPAESTRLIITVGEESDFPNFIVPMGQLWNCGGDAPVLWMMTKAQDDFDLSQNNQISLVAQSVSNPFYTFPVSEIEFWLFVFGG